MDSIRSVLALLSVVPLVQLVYWGRSWRARAAASTPTNNLTAKMVERSEHQWVGRFGPPSAWSGVSMIVAERELQSDAPTRSSALFEAGKRAARAGRAAVARDLLMDAIQLEPGNVDAWVWLAAVVERPAEAASCLELVLQLHPDNRQAQAGLAELARLGLWSPAA